jgi:hypothetical protein
LPAHFGKEAPQIWQAYWEELFDMAPNIHQCSPFVHIKFFGIFWVLAARLSKTF